VGEGGPLLGTLEHRLHTHIHTYSGIGYALSIHTYIDIHISKYGEGEQGRRVIGV